MILGCGRVERNWRRAPGPMLFVGRGLGVRNRSRWVSFGPRQTDIFGFSFFLKQLYQPASVSRWLPTKAKGPGTA